ncbi:hypothetical protein MRX96_042647 [Rhipicephalus microplus]
MEIETKPFLTVTKLLLGATLSGEHLPEQPAKLTRSTAATEEAAGAAALQRLRRYLVPDHPPGTTHGGWDIPHQRSGLVLRIILSACTRLRDSLGNCNRTEGYGEGARVLDHFVAPSNDRSSSSWLVPVAERNTLT